jgi:hypothetical protein
MVRKRRFALAFSTLLSLVPVLSASCSKERGPVRDARAEAAATVGQRLQGRWVLVTFQPETPLEPVLQLLLNEQFNRLVVEFRGQALVAQGPGVTINRTYTIGDAYVDHFKATIYDSYGVGVDSVCDFSGDMLLVNGITAPWRGRASFRRAL